MPEIDSATYYNLIFPLFIALSRVADVILGTFRIVLVVQGRKALAAMFGFFEILIWVSVAGQVLGELNNFSYYLAWSVGFAIGTYLGMLIEEKISLGVVILRIIITDTQNYKDLLNAFHEEDISMTVVDSHGKHSNSKILFSVMPRKKLVVAEKLIHSICPQSFYSVENVRSVHSPFTTNVRKQTSYFRRVFPRGKSK